MLVVLGTFGVAAWVAFIKYANNQERLTSSITQQILQNLRDSPEVNELLGDAIRPEPVWYLNGDPWVDGVVRPYSYDVSFDPHSHTLDVDKHAAGECRPHVPSQGSQRYERECLTFEFQVGSSFTGSGTVYFTSIRRAKGQPFTIRTSLPRSATY